MGRAARAPPLGRAARAPPSGGWHMLQRTSLLRVSGLFANPLAAVALSLLQSCAAAAVDNCNPEPSAKSLDSSHWTYRIDRSTGRECWFVVRSGTRLPQSEAVEVQPSPEANSQAPFQSLFSSLSNSLSGQNQTG